MPHTHLPDAQVFVLPLHPLFQLSDIKRVKMAFAATPPGQWLDARIAPQNQTPAIQTSRDPYTVIHDSTSHETYLIIFDRKLAAEFKILFP